MFEHVRRKKLFASFPSQGSNFLFKMLQNEQKILIIFPLRSLAFFHVFSCSSCVWTFIRHCIRRHRHLLNFLCPLTELNSSCNTFRQTDLPSDVFSTHRYPNFPCHLISISIVYLCPQFTSIAISSNFESYYFCSTAIMTDDITLSFQQRRPS